MEGEAPTPAGELPALLIFLQKVLVRVTLFVGYYSLSQLLLGMNEITEMRFFIIVQDVLHLTLIFTT